MPTRCRLSFDLRRPISIAFFTVVTTLFVIGCGQSEDESEGLAFRDDEPIANTVASSPTSLTSLPVEVSEDELPELLGERLNLMNEWLRGHAGSKSSGNGSTSTATSENGSETQFTIEMFVNTTDRLEAEALCPLYVEAARTYGGTKGQPAEITLSGWVPTDRGVFADPGWDRVNCDLA